MGIEGVPDEMLAVRLTEFHKPYEIKNVPTPDSLKEHEILLKTAVASLCHTDGMVVDGKFPTQLPCIASHEGTGTVVAVGSKVSKFKKGDRVMAGIPRNPCTECDTCTAGRNDWIQYCENMEGHNGVIIDGAFAEYHIADSRSSARLPDELSLLSGAPLACAGATIYRSILVSEVTKDGWLGIVGAGGGLGHLGIQMALAQGINVVAIDARDGGLELCTKAGAKHVLDARKGHDETVKEVQKLTDGRGVHATINVSEAESAAPLACAITRMHGIMVQVSQPDTVNIPFMELIFRDIVVKGSLIAGGDQAQEMVDLVAKHKIQVETNVFHGLKEVPKMVELSHSGKMKGKAVCVVDQEQLDQEKGKVVA